jgi:hypothetical protein
LKHFWIEKQKEHKFQTKRKEECAAGTAAATTGNDLHNVLCASGASVSYKQSAGHLDTFQKVNRPYVPEGTNTYRRKAGAMKALINDAFEFTVGG